VDKLQLELRNHPNQGKVAYVLNGLKEGFHLGFEPSTSGRTFFLSPFVKPALSGFGVIPKCNQECKWCLILDLSSPTGNSVNDGIPKDKFSVQYMHVDDIIIAVMEMGRGALIAKFDIKMLFALSRYTQMTVTSWACNGEISSMWI
jgi:hypothetical protein